MFRPTSRQTLCGCRRKRGCINARINMLICPRRKWQVDLQADWEKQKVTCYGGAQVTALQGCDRTKNTNASPWHARPPEILPQLQYVEVYITVACKAARNSPAIAIR